MIEQLMGHVWQLHCAYAIAYLNDIMMAKAYAASEGSPKLFKMNWPCCKPRNVYNWINKTTRAL